MTGVLFMKYILSFLFLLPFLAFSDVNNNLIEASKLGNESLVKDLIEQGLDVNARDKEGKTSLYYAVIQEDQKVTEILLQNQANVNITDNNGKTPLHLAVLFNQQEGVRLLFQYGADPNLSANYGTKQTPFDYVRMRKDKSLIEIFIQAERSIKIKCQKVFD